MSTIAGKRPLVSVIVPTYADRAPRLQSALASIWAQAGLGERFDIEPIVVDNASTGPTEEVVRGFPGTRYLRFDTNRGAAAARNAGLGEATGKYVAFLDDDDLWLPHRLSVHVPVLEQAAGVEVVYGQRIKLQEDQFFDVIPAREGPSGWIFEALFKGTIVCTQTVTIPREAFDRVGGFDERLSLSQDTDMWFRLALHFRFRYVPGIAAIYVQSRGWAPSQVDELIRCWLVGRDNILSLVHGAPNEAEIKRFVLSGTRVRVISMLLEAGRFDEARRAFLQSLADFPAIEADTWYGSVMKRLTLQLALASDSNAATHSWCGEVKRAGGRGGIGRRLRMRRFLADVWTAVALRFASGCHRDDSKAGSAAARAILLNPLKPLSRPGLLRLLARAIAPLRASVQEG